MPLEWNQLSGAVQAVIARAAIVEVSMAIAEDAQLFAGTVRQMGESLRAEDALIAFAARMRVTAVDAQAVSRVMEITQIHGG